MQALLDKKWFSLTVIILLTVIWGTAWSVGKIATENGNPEIEAFWRYFIAFLSFIPIFLIRRPTLSMDRKTLFFTLLAGIFTGVFAFCFFMGLNAGLAGYGGTLVTSLSPILTYILATVIFRIRIVKMQMIGLLTGILAGAVMLEIWHADDLLDPNILYFVIAASSWAIVTISTQKAVKNIDLFVFSAIVFATASLINLIVAWPHHPFDVMHLDRIFWLTLLYAGIVSTSLSNTLFFYFAHKIGAQNIAVYMFIIPASAMVSSFLIFGEDPAATTIIGCLLAFAAVILFNFSKTDQKEKVVIEELDRAEAE